MLQEQASEERNLDLNKEQDIIIEDSREEHWMDVSNYDKDNSKIHDLRWEVYTSENEELIKR